MGRVVALASLVFAFGASAALAVPPVANPLEAPAVSGSPTTGNTLVCTNGGWAVLPDGSPTRYVRTWLRGPEEIPGSSSETPDAATPASYKLTEADANSVITCRVTAYNGAEASLPASSVPTAVVGLGAPQNVTPPVITPVAMQVGQTASCNPGTWLNSASGTRSYEWTRQGETKVGEGSTYVATADDAGSILTCTETVTNSAGSASAPSTPVIVAGTTPLPPLPIAPINATLPMINGTPQAGRMVTCQAGLWLNEPTAYAYQWKRDGASIPGATNANYTLTASDVGRPVTCAVAASNSHGSSSAASLPIFPIAAGLPIPYNQTAPSITGTPQAGSELTCNPGSWVPASGLAYSYQWNANGGPIAGATSAKYTVVDANVGQSLTCTVTASNDIGSSRATSAAVRPVAGPSSVAKPVSLSPPQLSGTAREGKTLSCTQGTWSGAPSTFLFRWVRGDKLIGGATQASYRVQGADVGQQVGCAVAAGNSAGYGVALSRRMRATARQTVDRKAPRVTNFRFQPKKLTLRSRGKTRRNGAFRWKLSEPARVTILVERKVPGYRGGKRCVRVTKKLRSRLARKYAGKPGVKRRVARELKRKRCTIWRGDGRAVGSRTKGANKLAFNGKIGKRKLRAGSYRASITAVDAARNVSKPRRVHFKLIAPRR